MREVEKEIERLIHVACRLVGHGAKKWAQDQAKRPMALSGLVDAPWGRSLKEGYTLEMVEKDIVADFKQGGSERKIVWGLLHKVANEFFGAYGSRGLDGELEPPSERAADYPEGSLYIGFGEKGYEPVFVFKYENGNSSPYGEEDWGVERRGNDPMPYRTEGLTGPIWEYLLEIFPRAEAEVALQIIRQAREAQKADEEREKAETEVFNSLQQKLEAEFKTLAVGAVEPSEVVVASVKGSSGEQGLYRLECPKCHGFVGVSSYEDYGYGGDPGFHLTTSVAALCPHGCGTKLLLK